MDIEDLKICAQINLSCKQILQNPIFCLSKFEHLSKKNKEDWIKVIQSVENSDKGIAIISYLQWSLKKDALMDLPCYSCPAVQDDFRRRIRESWEKRESSDEDREIVKILTPLTDNLNAPGELATAPIYWTAINGHTEIAKILYIVGFFILVLFLVAPLFFFYDTNRVWNESNLLGSIFWAYRNCQNLGPFDGQS